MFYGKDTFLQQSSYRINSKFFTCNVYAQCELVAVKGPKVDVLQALRVAVGKRKYSKFRAH